MRNQVFIPTAAIYSQEKRPSLLYHRGSLS